MLSNGIKIIKSGKVFVKGVGLFGALGLGNLNDQKSFQKLDLQVYKAKQIATGWGHSAILTDTDRLLLFGRPYEFNTLLRMNFIYKISPFLGRFVSQSSNIFGMDSSGLYMTPMLLDSIENIQYVSCSAGITLILDKLGHIYAFGVNKFGQCGISEKILHVYQPNRINIPTQCQAIDTGFQHCVALTIEGKVYCWGKGKRGQLGQYGKPNEYSTIPLLVQGLDNIISISSGFNHITALDKLGNVYIWGKHMSLKRKTTTSVEMYEDQLTPRRIDLPQNHIAVEICSSNFATIIRCSNGTLWAIGLGERDRNNNVVPLPVLSDFNSNLHTELAQQDIPIIVSEHTCMKKGYTRVSVLDSQRHVPFEIILHNREAYGREIEGIEDFLNIKPADSVKDKKEDQIAQHDKQGFGQQYTRGRVIDYSSGWRHSLAIIEDTE